MSSTGSSGALLPNCDQLEVTRQGGKTQCYRIFDHVSVHITVQDSAAHGLGLRLELKGKPVPAASSSSKVTKQDPAGDELKIRADQEMIDVSVLLLPPIGDLYKGKTFINVCWAILLYH